MTKRRTKNQKNWFWANKGAGLGLLGLLISIFIVTVGLMGIVSLANTALKGAAWSEMRLIASGLAQEGIEIVRDIRRSNPDWDDWEWYKSAGEGGYPVGFSEDYRTQYNSAALLPYLETSLKFNDSSGLYQYDSGTDSFFYRKVTLEKISDEELKVIAEIKWQIKGQEHFLRTQDRLWNWK